MEGLAPDTPSRLRSPDHQRKKPSHFPMGFSVDFSRSLHFRHGFAHLAGVSGADPGRTAGSFSSECPGGGAPARKRWGGTGALQRQRPPPAAETGSCRWGRGQQDASDSEAAAGCRNPSLFAEKAPCWPANYYRRNCELPTHSFDTGAPAPQNRGEVRVLSAGRRTRSLNYGRRTYSKDHG